MCGNEVLELYPRGAAQAMRQARLKASTHVSFEHLLVIHRDHRSVTLGPRVLGRDDLTFTISDATAAVVLHERQVAEYLDIKLGPES